MPTINKTHINPTIFETMGMVNTINIKDQKDDLRNSIKQSAADEGLYKEENNIKHKATKTGADVLWGAKAEYKKGKSKSVVNYKAAKKESSQHNLNRINREQMEDDSHLTLNKSSKRMANVTRNKAQAQTDVEYAPERDKSKMVGGMGTKYMTPYMELDGDVNDINDR
jgi:hypothetical protein